jgi:hypothetical protein
MKKTRGGAMNLEMLPEAEVELRRRYRRALDDLGEHGWHPNDDLHTRLDALTIILETEGLEWIRLRQIDIDTAAVTYRQAERTSQYLHGDLSFVREEEDLDSDIEGRGTRMPAYHSPVKKSVHFKQDSHRNSVSGTGLPAYQSPIKTADEEGEGFFSTIGKIFTGKYSGEKGVISFLQDYGETKITKLSCYRKPIEGLLSLGLTGLTAGKIDAAIKKQGYDKLFHLFMLINDKFLVEKNDIVNMTTKLPQIREYLPDDGFDIPVTKNLTINQMVDNCKQKIGEEHFFVYKPFSWNCQDFIWNLLDASGLGNPAAKQFILQDAKSIEKEIPSWSAKLAGIVTDIAAGAKQLFGKGIGFNRVNDQSHIGLINRELLNEGFDGTSSLQQRTAAINRIIRNGGFDWLISQQVRIMAEAHSGVETPEIRWLWNVFIIPFYGTLRPQPAGLPPRRAPQAPWVNRVREPGPLPEPKGKGMRNQRFEDLSGAGLPTPDALNSSPQYQAASAVEKAAMWEQFLKDHPGFFRKKFAGDFDSISKHFAKPVTKGAGLFSDAIKKQEEERATRFQQQVKELEDQIAAEIAADPTAANRPGAGPATRKIDHLRAQLRNLKLSRSLAGPGTYLTKGLGMGRMKQGLRGGFTVPTSAEINAALNRQFAQKVENQNQEYADLLAEIPYVTPNQVMTQSTFNNLSTAAKDVALDKLRSVVETGKYQELTYEPYQELALSKGYPIDHIPPDQIGPPGVKGFQRPDYIPEESEQITNVYTGKPIILKGWDDLDEDERMAAWKRLNSGPDYHTALIKAQLEDQKNVEGLRKFNATIAAQNPNNIVAQALTVAPLLAPTIKSFVKGAVDALTFGQLGDFVADKLPAIVPGLSAPDLDKVGDIIGKIAAQAADVDPENVVSSLAKIVGKTVAQELYNDVVADIPGTKGSGLFEESLRKRYPYAGSGLTGVGSGLIRKKSVNWTEPLKLKKGVLSKFGYEAVSEGIPEPVARRRKALRNALDGRIDGVVYPDEALEPAKLIKRLNVLANLNVNRPVNHKVFRDDLAFVQNITS